MGTVTVCVDGIVNSTVTDTVPTSSQTDCEIVVNCTCGELSRISSVKTVIAPNAALVEVPRVISTVSLDSTVKSLGTATEMEPVVCPARITTWPVGLIVRSAAPLSPAP